LAATFGSAGAYDEFIRAGTRALEEGKTPEEAVKIGKTSAIVGGTLMGGLGAVAPAQAPGMKAALKAGGVMGLVGAAIPFAENITERAQGLKTPLTEGVLEGGLTMGALPPGMYGLGKVVGLVPRAFQALRGGEAKPTETPPGAPTAPAARTAREPLGPVEVEYFVGGEPVELIEANPAKGVALVKMPDGNTRSVTPEQLSVRRKGEANASQEREAEEAVSGLPSQPGFGEGEVPTQEGGRRVSGAQAQGAQSEISLKARQEALDAVNELTQAKAGGAAPEKVSQLEAKLAGAMDKAEMAMDPEDVIDLNLAVRQAQRRTPPPIPTPAPPPMERPTGLSTEQQTQYNDALDKLIGIVTAAKAKGGRTTQDVFSAARGRGEEEQAQRGIYGILESVAGENQRLGLPSRFSQVNLPAGVGTRGIAWTKPDGEIVFNWRELFTWLQDVPKERRTGALKAVFTEEGIHSMARRLFKDEELAGLWNGLTAVERGLVNKSYIGSFRGRGQEGQTFTPAQMGHEYLRRVMQRALRGELSERAEGFKRISQAAIDMI
jgi:hypothetical protein